ncbi:MAG: dephospho-CoA kinase [Bacteroidia bacterium]|nr:dephospho-CoA kinase [Bacteroidia bacterium]
MKKIGITGGIGSGKTTVCEIFKLLGISTFHADDEARNLQNNDLQIKNLLIELFGKHIYSHDGLLDRKKLAGVIFSDTRALEKVNSIIHPAVRQSFLKWVDQHLDAPYVLYEAAVLLESGYASDFDRNILILADEKVRIERVIRRDRTSEELVRQRIVNQMPDIQKIKMVDYTIENNNKKLLFPQIIELDKRIRADG